MHSLLELDDPVEPERANVSLDVRVQPVKSPDGSLPSSVSYVIGDSSDIS